MYFRLFTLCLILFCAQYGIGQMSHSVRGFMLSSYNQEIGSSSLNKDYLYRSYSLSILQKKKIVSSPIMAVTFDLQTQLGMTHVSDSREFTLLKKGIEVAMLFGINLEASLLPKFWWIYVGGSIGPQFISLSPSRQSKGFIFSDSIYAGSRLALGIQHQLDIRAGLRHQSNAGFSDPNGGIDAIFIKAGVLMNI